MGVYAVVKASFSKIPTEVLYIFTLFIITRVVLTFIGVFSRTFTQAGTYFNISLNQVLTIWGVWDTSWYLDIAQNGYLGHTNTLGQSSFAFFPLYPLIIRLLGIFIGDYFNAGLIISNICLIVACFFIYRLVRLDDDQRTAMGSIKYLLLFPTAFILSGVFSESLFLMLAIMCFYYAKKQNWMFVSGLGLLLSLARPLGVFVMIPLIYEYLRAGEFKIRAIKPDFLFFALIPLGLILYMTYNYYLTGDPLAFYHVESAWGRSMAGPVQSLIAGFSARPADSLFLATFTVIPLVLVTVFYKKIGFTYWLYSIISMGLPVLTGNLQSSPRYALMAFPIFILFTRLSKDESLDQYLIMVLALMQGFLMVLWTTGIGVLM